MRKAVFVLGVALAAGCLGPGAGTPEERARAILERHARDEDAAREAWRADPANWRLGLDHEVAASDPVAPALVRTERELVTASVARCGGGAAPVAFRTDVFEAGGEVFARFRWPTLDHARAGHGRVRAALAEGRGDPGALWERVTADAALADACISFRGRLDRCRG